MHAGPLLLSTVDCNSVSRDVIIINILTCYSGIKIDWPLQHKYGQPCYVTVAVYKPPLLAKMQKITRFHVFKKADAGSLAILKTKLHNYGRADILPKQN